MVAAVIFSNTVWTFWDIMLLFFLWIPLLMLWFFCMFDVFGRRDLNGWGKAAWLLAVIVLPWIGSLAYLIFRPNDEYAGRGPYDYDGAYSTPGAVNTPSGKVPTG